MVSFHHKPRLHRQVTNLSMAPTTSSKVACPSRRAIFSRVCRYCSDWPQFCWGCDIRKDQCVKYRSSVPAARQHPERMAMFSPTQSEFRVGFPGCPPKIIYNDIVNFSECSQEWTPEKRHFDIRNEVCSSESTWSICNPQIPMDSVFIGSDGGSLSWGHSNLDLTRTKSTITGWWLNKPL